MILGNEAPKMVNGATTILLDYANLDTMFSQGDVIENVSPIDGTRTYIIKGDYSEFKVPINLFQYGNATNRKNKFLEVYNQRKNLVDFYPHRDGYPIKNEAGNIVKFAIVDINLDYEDDDINLEVLSIHVKSTGYTDISKGLV
ncbi:MAG: hypothetical protein RDU14_17485 [Melioribacteraceae bacterium]|jgi:hypothetical protein|nr:hypothetical protein [Melioribacteraceae bacterium]